MERAVNQRVIISGALLLALVAVAWSGSLNGENLTQGPSWAGLRGALAVALVGLALLYAEGNRFRPNRSSTLLAVGSVVAAVFVFVAPAMLLIVGLPLPGAELGLVGSLVALSYLGLGAYLKQNAILPLHPLRFHLLVSTLTIGMMWLVFTTTPFSVGMVPILHTYTALLWGALGIYIVRQGFRSDAEAITALGVACLSLGTAQLLTLTDSYPPAIEILGLAGVAMAVASAYLDLIGTVDDQQEALAHTREAMRDLAHEARNAIAAIEGTIYGLEDRDDLTDDDRESLRSALRLELESLRLMLSCEQTEPITTFRPAEVLAPLAAASPEPIRLSWLTPPDLEVAFGQAAMHEVIQSLIENARVHGDSGSITVEVAKLADRAELSVVDRGQGVAPELATSLFSRGAKRHDSPGRGLGLDIARRLARTHGGDLVYADDSDGGARFTLAVPLADRVLDLTAYESDQPVEVVDDDGLDARATDDHNGGDSRFPGKFHRDRGIGKPSGELPGV